MCNCLNVMTALLRVEKDDPDASIDTVYIFGKAILLTPRIAASYRMKKQDGTYARRNTSTSVIPTYCPFCGIAYDQEQGDGNEEKK